MTPTITIQAMAEALLNRDDLRLHLLLQAWLPINPNIPEMPYPETQDKRVLTAAAALAELLALQLNQAPPDWTKDIGGLPQPFFVMSLGEKPGFTRNLCLAEAPEPFKRRNIFAPANFLNTV